MIENKQYRISRSDVDIDDARSLYAYINEVLGRVALRWYIAQITAEEVVVEASVTDEELHHWPANQIMPFYPGKCAVLSIVPTGVGCSIGGYAGDAAPSTNLMSAAVDYLITNPNAVNASNFVSLGSNVIYTDGCSIDGFCKGLFALHIPYANKVGLVIEKADDRSLDLLFNVINTVRAVHGVDIIDQIITDKPLGSRCVKNRSGAYVGSLDNPRTLYSACERLLANGADAIAITSNIQDLPMDDYARHFAGESPNPVGGVEAIISYAVANRYQIPVAHAPLLNVTEMDLVDRIVDARGAGEFASESGLACILIGLRAAPQIKPSARARILDVININNVLAVVTPASCLGGIPNFCAQERGIPLIAVGENQTVLDVRRSKLRHDNVIEVENYLEAAGAILALRKGIALASLRRPLRTARY